ncbi:MAG: hypothetical protein ABSH33_15145 [Steroidobacteraceae bacterium]|jgi:hypothetical protein
MATPADQRLLELLEKWLTSLDLHAKYCSLDDGSYSKIQPWPEHQRPSRWIIDLARQKALALQAQIQDRIKMGDAKFSDSLELMTFLANLVGSEHIERFIPLAEPAQERALGGQDPDAEASAPADAATGTREMPRFIGNAQQPAPVGTAAVARTERKPAEPQPAAPKHAAPAPAYNRNGPSDEAREQVIADAARLVQWGRKWYELAELIASMADRPHLTDVRRILKDNKAVIDEKAGRT